MELDRAMLLRFRTTNFASLRDEAEISLISANEHPDVATRPVPREQLRALPAAGIFGPNASGKSNVINALGFAQDAVRLSHQRWLPDEPIPGRQPFRLDRDSAARPSEFVFDLVLDDVRYEYGFSLDDVAVRREWLYAFPKGRRQVYAERDADQMRFGNNLSGPRESIARATRPNSLFISAAAASHPQLGRIYRWFTHGQTATAGLRHDPPAPKALPDKWMIALLRFADLGIIGADIPAANSVNDAPTETPPSDGFRTTAPGPTVELLHAAATDTGQVSLPWRSESSGTKSLYSLLQLIGQALATGGLLAVDNLGRELHPLLTAEIVGLFHSADTNPHGAQIIFTTHDIGLLGRHQNIRLARDQVWLTEKDQAGATRLYPLTEFRVRNALDDVAGRYLKGRYGAVPFFDKERLLGPNPAGRSD
ncbi:ATP-binding protein [Micromonospora sp. DH14]|uniref:AAA family ATPase n=1 Tax=Micromonospora sp. DH14 TaxID=3040120 RepID=UPI0024431A0D|nr:ATP-binding protein [Micromonospora sp. DH14]MDG9674871.1 ATP-binding protein [Micromonospora sp. DH14]